MLETPRAGDRLGGLVSAPGSAPATFASAMLRLVAPRHIDAIDANDALMAREWSASGYGCLRGIDADAAALRRA